MISTSVVVLLCVVSGALGDKCHFACPDIYEPVCGSDGKTYPSFCDLQAEQCTSNNELTMVYPGECKVKRSTGCPEICTLEYAPVCGSDGKTYPNYCELEVEQCKNNAELTMVYPGACKNRRSTECPEECTLEYKPVCGSDGITYPNYCALRMKKCKSNAELTAVHPGICKQCPEICTLEYEPVCGSDGKTYLNYCELEMEQCKHNDELTVSYPGECKTKRSNECLDKCIMDYMPVCGSNGKTYTNYCELLVEQCKNNGELTVAYPGVCKSLQKLSVDPFECPDQYRHGICTMDYRPVCGSDGKTYGNKCTFCYAKTIKNDNGEELNMDYVGECGSDDLVKCVELDRKGYCTRQYMPICASDGKTHANRCTFCFDKFEREANGEVLTAIHFGKC